MNLTEIEDLAELISIPFLVNGQVDLEAIAADKNISLIYGYYGDYFLGQLVHEDDEFYIHINLDKVPDKRAPRTRFTLAHDLGHYFIDDHRNLLKKGISLSYNPDHMSRPKPRHEIEADHFASYLLLPKSAFVEEANKLEPGIPSILHLQERFNSSIECTAIQYVKRNIHSCLLIRWYSNKTDHYSFYSDSLAQMLKLTGRPSIKIQSQYLQSTFMEIGFSDPKIKYTESLAPISKWVANIAPGSVRDLIGTEQIFQLGNFGGMTLLIFN